MERELDIVESLLRSAGRRVEPPADAYHEVYAAAHEAFQRKASRRRDRRWLLGAAAAAALAFVVVSLMRWTPLPNHQGELARIVRVLGDVEVASGDAWHPLAESPAGLKGGMKVRTHADARVVLELVGGESLRLAGGTEIMLDAPGRLYLQGGTLYADSGAPPAAARLEIVTPAGTARDLGTQFELSVAGAALRLRVREGAVALDRGGQSLTGQAGEQIEIDGIGSVLRARIPPNDAAWQWAESIAPMPDMDGMPVATLIAWVARETGRRVSYESPIVEQHATAIILHGDIRHLPPMAALEAMLATTDLVAELNGDTMEIRSRSIDPSGP